MFDSKISFPARELASPLIVLILTLAFMLVYADRNGFEGDDLNSILPMLHLRAALAGDLLIYRPNWQPLSYEIGAAVYALTGRVETIFALPQICMAIGVALIYRATRLVGLTPLLFVPLLFLFPEVLFSGLYYNSSALGFPLVCLAVLLALEGPGRVGAVMTGVTLATAVLIRIDFVLIAPLVVMFRLWHRRNIVDILVVGLSSVLIFLLALVLGVLDPGAVIDTYATARQEIIDRANDPGWDDRTKLLAASVVFSPMGWVFLAVAVLWTALHPKMWIPAMLGLLCVAPMLLAARNILTPKYMLPAFALLPVIAAMIWVKATAQMPSRARRILAVLWIAATCFFLVAAVEPTRNAPFVYIALEDSRRIGTHDGPRSWGSYLWHMGHVSSSWSDRAARADTLFVTLSQPRARAVIFVGDQGVFSPGGTAWRHLQLRLENAGIHGALQDRGVLHFEMPAGPVVLMSPDAQTLPEMQDACRVNLREKVDAETVLEAVAACSDPT